MTREELLSNKLWYHVTTTLGYERILETKVRASVNKNQPRDFGYGFYLNKSLDWSRWYIEKVLNKGLPEENLINYVVLGINFCLENVEKKYGVGSILYYDSQQQDGYAEFVFNNRAYYESYRHSNDVVAGPMASLEQIDAIRAFRNDKASKAEVIAFLKGKEEETQILLHKQRICDMIRVKKDILKVYSWDELRR